MSEQRPYWLEARYGPGGRAGGKGRVGECEGDLAFRIEFATPEARALDEEIARRRPDLVVWVGENTNG